MSDKKLRVIQVGADHDHAAMAIDSLKRQNDLFEILGYVRPPEDTDFMYRNNTKFYEGIPEMTFEEACAAKPDVMVIETTEKLLTKYAFAAAKLGIPVYMDKPGGDVTDEYLEMLDYMKAHNIPFVKGYMYRYNPAVIKALQMVKNGDLGDIIYVEAQMNCLHGPEKREWLKKYKGGMMFFLGCHLVDLIMQIQGDPEEILPFNTPTGLDGVSGEDFGMAMMRYPTGWSFAKSTAVEPGGFIRRQLIITGTKGVLQLEPLEYYVPSETPENMCTDLYYTSPEIVKRDGWNVHVPKETYGPINRYDAMIRTFAEVAQGKRPMPYSYDYEAKLYKAVMAACGAEKWVKP